MRRARGFLLVVVVALGIGAAAALGTSGGLRQKAGTDGCVSQTGSGGECEDGRALTEPTAVVVAPDGGEIYAASWSAGGAVGAFVRTPRGELEQAACVAMDDVDGCTIGRALSGPQAVASVGDNVYSAGNGGVAVFDRGDDGALTQKAGAAGCIVEVAAAGCTEADGIASPSDIAVAPTGDDAYVVSGSGEIALFDRLTDGALDWTGCLVESPDEGSPCDDVRATGGAQAIAMSPDGENVYVASGNGIAILSVVPGGLEQADGRPGCVSSFRTDCLPARGIGSPTDVAVSPDGGNVYVTSEFGTVAIFDRGSGGALTQPAGAAGCASNTGSEDCADAEALTNPWGIAVSGTAVYVASQSSSSYYGSGEDSAIAVFDRAADGTLDQKEAPFGCVADVPGAVDCTDAVALAEPLALALSPDGANLYAAAIASDAVAVFDVDEAAPETTITAGPEEGAPTNDATPTFAFEADEPATFECALDGEGFDCESPFTPAEPLDDGEHTFSVVATDESGNVDDTPTTRTFVVDTVAPDTEILDAPGSPTADNTPTFEFWAGRLEPGATFTCSIDGGTTESCDSPHTTEPLGDGPHTFSVAATDAAGNTDPTPATDTFTVDASPPDTTITSGPADGSYIDDPTPAFAFESLEPPPTGEGATPFVCRIDGDEVDCDSPRTLGPFADGTHTFEVSAVDDAGNADPTPATRTFTVDTVAPVTTITAGPRDDEWTNDPTPTFEFAASEPATFACAVDGGDEAACTSPGTAEPLDDDRHTFAVRATDRAGNVEAGAEEVTFRVDTVPPVVTVDPPGSPTSDTTPTWTFEADEPATLACELGAIADECSSPITPGPLDDGSYVLTVTATDRAGNVGSATAPEVVVDTRAPAVAFTAGPADGARINDPTPTFAFAADEPADLFCRIDEEASAACVSAFTTRALADGAHTITVFAIDRAGNDDLTPPSRSFTVDTRAPETTITSGPEGTTTEKPATFAFTADSPDATFTCRLDAGGWLPCLGAVTFADPGFGPHTFRVRAADALGNVDPDPASRSWTLALRPEPVTRFLGGPSGRTYARRAGFRFAADRADVSFECRLDDAAWRACENGVVLRRLSFARHVMRVRATDSDGVRETSPAVRRWTVLRRPLPRRTRIVAAWDRFKDAPHELLFTSLRVRNVPAGTTIRLACAGPGCPGRTPGRWRLERFAETKSLTAALAAIRLRPGARVDVTLAKRGYAGIGKRYCVRSGRPPRIREYMTEDGRPRCR